MEKTPYKKAAHWNVLVHAKNVEVVTFGILKNYRFFLLYILGYTTIAIYKPIMV